MRISASSSSIARLTIRRSVPTQNDIAVPETLQKKAKAQQKLTEARAAETQKRRQVR